MLQDQVRQTFEALFGLRRPSEGKVNWGEDFTYASPRRYKKIGYVPQDRLS